MTAEILHCQPVPKEMTSPPYGAVVTVYQDHTTLDLPYLQGGTIILLHGEKASVGLVYDPSTTGLMLQVSREKIADASAA